MHRRSMLAALAALLPLSSTSIAQNMPTPSTSSIDPSTSLAMKTELRELVDRFSILADRKEAIAQTRLFTQNAAVETFVAGKSVSRLEGREAIGKAFDSFLKGFDIVYHFNGQHLVTIDGDTAAGDLYCMTYLFSTEEAQKFKTTIGVRYRDTYVRQNGAWLIASRTSYFDWRQKEKID